MKTMTDAERREHRYPGPYVVRAKHEDAPVMGGTPADGWPYFVIQDREFPPGDTPLWLAHGIQDIALAHLFAAAPDMLDALKAARPALIDAGALVALAAVDLAIAKAEQPSLVRPDQ